MSDKPAEKIVHTEVPPAVTAALAFPAGSAPQKHDPLWNTRRRRLDASFIFWGASFWYFAETKTPEELIAIAGYATAIGAVWFGILGAYMGFVEWGRINGVVGSRSAPRHRDRQWDRDAPEAEIG